MEQPPPHENQPAGDDARSRQDLLKAAGLAAGAAAVGALARPGTAHAAHAGALQIDHQNAGTGQTRLDVTGAISGGAALRVEAPLADYGVSGSANSYGLVGTGGAGVLGVGSVGGVFRGTDAAVTLTPRDTPGPPQSASFRGDLAVDSTGVLWLCIAPGTPGTWIRISHGGANMLPEPKRVYDSRDPGAGGVFAGFSSRTIEVVQANIGVPAEARGIVCNLTVTATSNYGFLTAFPTGTTRPGTSNVNWAPGWTLANSATVRLGTQGRIDLYVELSDAHVIVDVAGYVL